MPFLPNVLLFHSSRRDKTIVMLDSHPPYADVLREPVGSGALRVNAC